VSTLPAANPMEGLFSTFKSIVESAAVLSALCFSAGWSCLFAYYNAFGIGLFDIDLPVTVSSIFAIKVLLHSFWPWATFVVGLVGYTALRRLARFRAGYEGLRDALILGELIAAAIVLAFAGVRVGHTSALADMNEATSELPAASFVSQLKPGATTPSCLTDGKLDCRMITHSKNFYYFFKPVAPNAQSPNIIVFSVPDSQVQMLRLERGVR
jgi:hypothetical protein